MSQKFTLDIPKPCEKGKNDWNISQKTDKGIFCSHCQSEVIDFSQKTPVEIKTFFKNYQQPVCGKFHPTQLTEYQISNQKPIWFSKMLVGGLLSFLVLQKIEAQSSPKKYKVIIFHRNDYGEMKQFSDSVENHKITIKGRIFEKYNKNEKKEDIPGASVILKNSKIGATTNAYGKFNFTIPKDSLKNHPVIVLSSIGFKSVELDLTNYLKNRKIEAIEQIEIPEANLVEDASWIGEVIIKYYSPTDWLFKKIRQFIR